MRKIGMSIWPAKEMPCDRNCVVAAAQKILPLKSRRSMSAFSFLPVAHLKKDDEQKERGRKGYKADSVSEVIRAVEEEHQAGRQQSQANQIEVAPGLFTIVGQEEKGEHEG
jgi:hypothetical protein